MTATAPRRKRLNLDERAALLQTGEEYRVAVRNAQMVGGIWLAALVVWVLLVISQTTVTMQAHQVYTGWGWPTRPAVTASNLSRATVRTAYVARRVAPQGWAGMYGRTLYRCINQPQCSAAYPTTFRWWWVALPDTRDVRTGIEWLTGLLIIALPVVALLVSDVMGWRRWERRYLAQEHRAAQQKRRTYERPRI